MCECVVFLSLNHSTFNALSESIVYRDIDPSMIWDYFDCIWRRIFLSTNFCSSSSNHVWIDGKRLLEVFHSRMTFSLCAKPWKKESTSNQLLDLKHVHVNGNLYIRKPIKTKQFDVDRKESIEISFKTRRKKCLSREKIFDCLILSQTNFSNIHLHEKWKKIKRKNPSNSIIKANTSKCLNAKPSIELTRNR